MAESTDSVDHVVRALAIRDPMPLSLEPGPAERYLDGFVFWGSLRGMRTAVSTAR